MRGMKKERPLMGDGDQNWWRKEISLVLIKSNLAAYGGKAWLLFCTVG
jgi:hypothetical protein